jgi:protein-L-isoaspartate(D-aspartate) O-methyltransferase
MMDKEAARRTFYANFVVSKAGISDPKLRRAFECSDRLRFLREGPWKLFTPVGYVLTPTAEPEEIYQDVVVALAPDRHINNGEPSLHARCIHALRIRPGERIVHIGAGSGYYTSILSTLVGPSGYVLATEIEADLCAWAQLNLKSHANVTVVQGQATGWEIPSTDVIYVNAGATSPQVNWLKALTVGGRLLFPLTDPLGKGAMILIRRESAEKYSASVLTLVGFIPCVGSHHSSEARAVSEALKKGGVKDVRSLRLGEPPDATAWLVGDGWWFSSAPP